MSQSIFFLRNIIDRILKFVSYLFKCVWVFFPSILFLLLAYLCFWTLGQGKDLMVAFAENRRAKLFFFIAIAFWSYAAWYSSRIISYLIARKQGKPVQFKSVASKDNDELNASNDYFKIPGKWLKRFPRLIGFSCILVIELAVLQLKVYNAPGAFYWNCKTHFYNPIFWLPSCQ
jgi:hypothetical protein